MYQVLSKKTIVSRPDYVVDRLKSTAASNRNSSKTQVPVFQPFARKQSRKEIQEYQIPNGNRLKHFQPHSGATAAVLLCKMKRGAASVETEAPKQPELDT